MAEVQACHLSIGNGDGTLANGLGVLSTGDGSHGEGDKFATVGLPEVNDIGVLLGIERHRHGYFGECTRSAKVENTASHAVCVLRSSSGIADPAEVCEIMLEW